mgnify:FL=1
MVGIKGIFHAEKTNLPHFEPNLTYLTLKMGMLSLGIPKNRFFGQSKCIPLIEVLIYVFCGDKGT